MALRRYPWEWKGGMAMIRPVAAAGALLALAVPFLTPAAVQADQLVKTELVVTQEAGDGQNAATDRRVRRLIMAALGRRGYAVLDGGVRTSAPGATILRVATERRILQGAYTSHATIELRATLIDGDTKRILARFDTGPGTSWRLAAHCPQSCIDQEIQRRVTPLVARLAADVDRRLVRLGRDRHVATADPTQISVAFRRIDPSLLPRIELYLRNFPGVTRIRRDYTASEGVLYRLSQDGTADGTELSLRKMLHHLQLTARIARTGNTYVVEADPTAQPATDSRDW
ncbi:MAG: hypothetical protein O3C34_00255 [Proteobacteria bacterium]|nr:hypothetical protein [Pseudomonadota bacterium]